MYLYSFQIIIIIEKLIYFLKNVKGKKEQNKIEINIKYRNNIYDNSLFIG